MLVLSADERAGLDALVAGTGAIARRAKIILSLAGEAPSVALTATKLATSPATVRHWRRRFLEQRLSGLRDRGRKGAPPKIGLKVCETIHSLRASGYTTRSIAERVGISQSSVARLIRSLEQEADETSEKSLRIDQDLIISLFESLADDEPWIRFLESLRSATRSDYGTLLVLTGDGAQPTLIVAADTQPAAIESYREEYYTRELFPSLPEGVVATLSDVISLEMLRETDFHKQFLEPAGIGFVLGVDLGTVRGITAQLRLSRLSTRKDYALQERAICQRIVPFLRASLNLFVRRADTETQREALSATVSGMAVGSILVDADSQIMEANATAQAILDMHDGLIVSAGRLELSNTIQSGKLQALIRRNAEASVSNSKMITLRSLLIERPSGREALSILVRPATGSTTSGLHIRPTTLINLVDPAQPRLALVGSLVQLFGLTVAEARVAMAIANGLSVTETAQTQQVSKNTIRSHLGSIYSKLGVSGQAGLVRSVLISVALLAAEGG